MARFGAGTPVTAGGTQPFLPAGLDSGEQAGVGGEDEELQRILALLQSAGGGGV